MTSTPKNLDDVVSIVRQAEAAKVNLGLTFIALLSFGAAFLVARTFTTIYPDTVVVSGGIHFHHFWYGLAMVVTAGWLGIVYTHRKLKRVYALVFGFGGGLIGDEVGLLLTFGNYQSQLTYEFLVGFACFVGLAILAIKYRDRLEDDVMSLGRGERLAHFGVAIAASSVLGLAFGMLELGLVVAVLGIAVVVAGVLIHKRS
jgi:hypothetical protein